MAGNSSPIYTRVGDIQGGATILTQAITDYTGVSVNVIPVFTADATNGGFVQRIRFKALGTTGGVTVARIWINEGILNQASTLSTPAAPTATPTGTGSSLYGGSFYAKVQAVDQWGGWSTVGAESSAVTPTTGQNIPWTWTAVSNAASYRLFVGPATGGEYGYFNTTTNSYTQTTIPTLLGNPLDFATTNIFYGEASLPSVTAIATAATAEIDYPMNIALPPGYRILVGLATTVTAGWQVSVIGGKY
jgi:hypothetical protein